MKISLAHTHVCLYYLHGRQIPPHPYVEKKPSAHWHVKVSGSHMAYRSAHWSWQVQFSHRSWSEKGSKYMYVWNNDQGSNRYLSHDIAWFSCDKLIYNVFKVTTCNIKSWNDVTSISNNDVVYRKKWFPWGKWQLKAFCYVIKIILICCIKLFNKLITTKLML